MTQTPPLGGRSKLPVPLTHLTGSPGEPSKSANSFSAFSVPGPKTNYSPFRFAGLQPPTTYVRSMQYAPRRAPKSRDYGTYTKLRLGHILSSRPLWFLLLFGALMMWWFHGGRDEMDLVRDGATKLSREFFSEERTRGLQFFPATNPKIHYVGRWTATPNRLRRDGTFAGVYFDIIVKNTTTLFLSLHNEADQGSESSEADDTGSFVLKPIPTTIRVAFRPISATEKPSLPISLLARIDEEEYILLPNASGLVSVRHGDLSANDEHRIRIVAPMTDDQGQGILEFEGLWLSRGGKLLRVEGSLLSEEFENEDEFSAENDQIGERHRTGLNGLLNSKNHHESGAEKSDNDDHETPSTVPARKKILEIITDSPGSFPGKRQGTRTGGADGLLAGVMGWEYLLGEMFGADHVGIGVDGMCLIQNCIGGVGQPNGLGDVFFRSGPYGSEHFDHPWMFDAYVPDVIVLNLGSSDQMSFENNTLDYEKTPWDLFERFENTYVSLVKGIRTLAYPQHPSTLRNEESGHHGFISDISPAFIPIFIMRPLRGQLEHMTQNVVNKLRADGDKAVFWLDTSGWLDVDVDDDEEEESSSDTGSLDFFLDDTTAPSRWRLTEQGNQRVAIFLHMHVCRYLAGEGEKCAFLPQEVYQGQTFDPEEAEFDRYLENEKERKLQKLFWSD